MSFWENEYVVQDAKVGRNKIEHEEIDDLLDINDDYKQFNMFDTAFCVNLLDMLGLKPLRNDHILWQGGLRGLRDSENGNLNRLDTALEMGAGAIEEFTNGQRTLSSDSGPCIQLQNGQLKSLSIYSMQGSRNSNGVLNENSAYVFSSNKDASNAVKKAASLYGADLVGIAPFDKRWIYNTEVYIPRDHLTGEILTEFVNIERKVEFGFEPKSVIVLAFEMDKEAYKTQPSQIGGAATTIGYSRMIETSLKVARFLQSLGYNGQHSGNDIGLSVPTAIQAGLGESSRMGLLVTEKYGARVRIAKVYTDLEMEYDKPISFGVKEICEKCKLCSKLCPAGAISKATFISDEDNYPQNCSNGLGVNKWYTDGQKCLAFWGENHTECGVCIANCVFSK